MRSLALILALTVTVSAQEPQADRQFLEQIKALIDAYLTPPPPPPTHQTVDVACEDSLPSAVASARLSTIDTTIQIDAGCTYEPISIAPSPHGRNLLITTRGRADKGARVRPEDAPQLAFITGINGTTNVVEIANGPTGAGNVTLYGIGIKGCPAGTCTLLAIGHGSETAPEHMAANVIVRQVFMTGEPTTGARRGIAGNGRDILVEQSWVQEVHQCCADAQAFTAWRGGIGVTIRDTYLSAGTEVLMSGGSSVPDAEFVPRNWLVQNVDLHKPDRWRPIADGGDGRDREVKNLLELKHGKDMVFQGILAVGNWAAAQDGKSILAHYATGGNCAPTTCGGVENVLIEDLVLLKATGGFSVVGYSYSTGYNANSTKKVRGLTVRNAYVSLTGTSLSGTLLKVGNVLGRHDLRFERITARNLGSKWFEGYFGNAWAEDGDGVPVRVPGGPIQGYWFLDSVVATNGQYGTTVPAGHYGNGLASFVTEELQIAGNVIGDGGTINRTETIARQLARYNLHVGSGALNVAAASLELLNALPTNACGSWFVRDAEGTIVATPGADCARLAPVFARLPGLPEQ